MASARDRRRPKAVIFGVAGPVPTAAERRLLADAAPLGFILFARNCVDPDQVGDLVADLRRVVGRADAPVLIDQEGGRVQRLKPPFWRAAPAQGTLGALADRDPRTAREAVYLNARLIADDLARLGISHDCAPVADLLQPGGDPIIGDRAFAADPDRVADLGRVACEGFLTGGVVPIVKHIPGHGRAPVDSHLSLPVVTADRATLTATDFRPFRALRQMPWAMTAHVVYTAFDGAAPATLSPTIIGEVIRGIIGFDGVLVSDDLCMQALTGSPADRARAALAAGCDVVLHCSGDLDEMAAVAAACPPLAEAAQARFDRARQRMTRAAATPSRWDRWWAEDRLAALLALVAV